MKGTLKELIDIQGEIEQLGFKKDEWLHARGWTNTTAPRTCRWMFQKKIGKTTYMVGRQTAIEIEEAL